MPLQLSRANPRGLKHGHRAPVNKSQAPDDSKTIKAMAADISAALGDLGEDALSPSAIAALQRNDVAAFMAALGFDRLGVALNDSLQMREAGVYLSKAYRAMLQLTPAEAKLSFNLIEPKAMDWALANGGKRVIAISQEVRLNISEIVHGALGGKAGDVYDTAKQIRDLVGLTPRWATAVNSTYARTLAAELADKKAYSEAQSIAAKARYVQAQRLLTVRSENIARTEIMTASNQGRYGGWGEQIGQGLVSAQSLKMWTVANPCPICAPMENEIVPWDSSFSGGFDMPPAHVCCECTGVLLPPDSTLDDIVGGSADLLKAKVKIESNPDTTLGFTNQVGESIAIHYRAMQTGNATKDDHDAYVASVLNRGGNK